ncbi:hypothetical protein LIER_22122 [Lithospermum erythrorhizon]|uniref:Dof-type domain-containing protein n=1 Tax=Lithospermum erythrorhizon TaxID=34254 RepID=A0AAV3QU88_LITER
MTKLRNFAIKLFGKTISLPPTHSSVISTKNHHYHHFERQLSSSALPENKNTSDFTFPKLEGDPNNTTIDEPLEHGTYPPGSEGLKTPIACSNTFCPIDKIKEAKTVRRDSIDKKTKKPEKSLPCPRCSSSDTKFCYFNNYNVKQPRHFCKTCQRFWTVGGTMRNVPVGSGRRKNKGNFALGPEHPKGQEVFPSPPGQSPQIPFFSGGSSWSSHWNAVCLSSLSSQKATFPSCFAVNFYPGNPFCISAVPVPWRIPNLIPPNQSMETTHPTFPSDKHHSDNGPKLQSNFVNWHPAIECNAFACAMPNKAFKINDVNDAGTSSIRSSIDIKESNAESFTRSSPFKAFDPTVDVKNYMADNNLILQANPAAF